MVDKQIKELNNNIKAFEYSFQNENEIKNEIFIAVIDENNKLIDMRVSKEKEDDIFFTFGFRRFRKYWNKI